MARFHAIDRTTDFLLPPSVQEWLPEQHLARYIANVVDSLDLSEIERAYAGRGSDAYHPAMLMSLLIYGYATGVFSSRQIERATYDSLAFRYLACNRHPDHDTLATFRRRFGAQFEAVFVQVLEIAHANRLSQFGIVSLDEAAGMVDIFTEGSAPCAVSGLGYGSRLSHCMHFATVQAFMSHKGFATCHP